MCPMPVEKSATILLALPLWHLQEGRRMGSFSTPRESHIPSSSDVMFIKDKKSRGYNTSGIIELTWWSTGGVMPIVKVFS